MKKVMTMIAVVAVAGSAMAGLTEFNWSGGANNGDATAGDQVMTYGGADVAVLEAAKLSGLLDPGLLSVAFDIQTVVIAPPFAGGTWGTLIISDPTSDRVGSDVIAVLDNDGVFTPGENIIIASAAGPLLELDTVPQGLPQEFNPGGTVSVQIVPEPATIGLMGIAGLGMFLARRKVRS
jgi:hypothetical protein